MFGALTRLFKPREFRLAWSVAIAADALQILVLPIFIAGILSPVNAVVDFSVAAILSKLIGWHWAFLPTIVAELLPGFDLFPTWTAAVLYVMWQRRHIYAESNVIRNVTPRRPLNS
jgi:hypothetical protein